MKFIVSNGILVSAHLMVLELLEGAGVSQLVFGDDDFFAVGLESNGIVIREAW